MSNNDGAVTLESQLDYRAQNDALNIFGFNEGHSEILSSDDVMKVYNRLLEAQSR